MTAHGEEVRTRILHAILEFQKRSNYNPTIQDIADEIQIGRSTAFKHLKVLRERGVVTLDRRFSGWRVVS